MTIQAYRLLTNAEQARLLKQEGVLLADRFLTGNRVFLFTLFGFYIELFHELNLPDRSGLRVLRVFDDPDALEVYLDRIDIRQLLTA